MYSYSDDSNLRSTWEVVSKKTKPIEIPKPHRSFNSWEMECIGYDSQMWLSEKEVGVGDLFIRSYLNSSDKYVINIDYRTRDESKFNELEYACNVNELMTEIELGKLKNAYCNNFISMETTDKSLAKYFLEVLDRVLNIGWYNIFEIEKHFPCFSTQSESKTVTKFNKLDDKGDSKALKTTQTEATSLKSLLNPYYIGTYLIRPKKLKQIQYKKIIDQLYDLDLIENKVYTNMYGKKSFEEKDKTFLQEYGKKISITFWGVPNYLEIIDNLKKIGISTEHSSSKDVIIMMSLDELEVFLSDAVFKKPKKESPQPTENKQSEDNSKKNDENLFASSLTIWTRNKPKGYEYKKNLNFQENLLAWAKERDWQKNSAESFFESVNKDIQINKLLNGEFNQKPKEEITKIAQQAIESILRLKNWVNPLGTAEDFYNEVFEDFLIDKQLINKTNDNNSSSMTATMTK